MVAASFIASVLALGDGEAAGHPPAGLVHTAKSAVHHGAAGVEVDRQPAAIEVGAAPLQPDIADHGDQPLIEIIYSKIATRRFAGAGYDDAAACIDSVDVDAALTCIGQRQPRGSQGQLPLAHHDIAGEDGPVRAVLRLGSVRRQVADALIQKLEF